MTIYVVEVGGRPASLRTASTVAAYRDHERAERAARSLRGHVVEYSVGRIPEAEEGAWREALRMQAQRDAERAVLEDQRADNAALRARYGAREDETMAQWLGRLHRGYQALQTIRQALVGPGILRDEEP